MQHSFNDGKYTLYNDNGKLTAFRNGEPWDRDLTGDNLIYWMLVEVDRLKAALSEMVEVNDEPCRLDHHGYCQSHFLDEVKDGGCRVANAKALLTA